MWIFNICNFELQLFNEIVGAAAPTTPPGVIKHPPRPGTAKGEQAIAYSA